MPPSSKDFFVQMLKEEIPVFGAVIRRLPTDTLEGRPGLNDAASPSDLLRTLIADCASLKDLLQPDDDRVNLERKTTALPSFTSPEEAAKIVESALGGAAELAEHLPEEQWRQETKAFKGEKFWIEAKGMIAWHHFFTLIQERGLLAAELSPGTEVPAST